jgi:hypothetical protein
MGREKSGAESSPAKQDRNPDADKKQRPEERKPNVEITKIV